MKICNKCSTVTNNFAKHTWCRDCTKTYNKDRKIIMRKQLNMQKNEWAKANPKLRHRSQAKTKYGLSNEQYDALQKEQHGLCAICQNPETARRNGKIKELSVDHDHITDEVRGLLCLRCNAALGLVKEDKFVLERMLVYINNHM